MSGMPASYDRWATGGRYKHWPAEVTCWNEACDNYDQWTPVIYEEEYGAAWYTPEECPLCGGEWHEDAKPADD